jgi:UDP-glucose-4-epimerase GalE
VRIIVTGGAGYIGSHIALALARSQHDVLMLDDLSNGHVEHLPPGTQLERADVTAPTVLDGFVRRFQVDAIVHLAARIQVGESVLRPDLYYSTNVGGMLRVVETATANRVPVVFSSTAAVYGEPTIIPIPVEHPCRPTNPYGLSKWISEQMLADAGRAGAFGWMALRYFNAAGAEVSASLGEDHEPETHLVPLAIDAALGTRPPIQLFGDDWPTADGTCVRDYIHVMDLAEAHVRALELLLKGAPSAALNLGTGEGATVRQVFDAVARAVGRPVPFKVAPRRQGDVAVLIADPQRSIEVLGWRPARSSLESIVRDATAARRQRRRAELA